MNQIDVVLPVKPDETCADYQKRLNTARLQNVEMFVTAYANTTGIDPDEAVLVEDRLSDGRTIFYFKRVNYVER